MAEANSTGYCPSREAAASFTCWFHSSLPPWAMMSTPVDCTEAVKVAKPINRANIAINRMVNVVGKCLNMTIIYWLFWLKCLELSGICGIWFNLMCINRLLSDSNLFFLIGFTFYIYIKLQIYFCTYFFSIQSLL